MIDALDECTDHEKTLNWVCKLISHSKAANLHIVVTSQPETDIYEIFVVLDTHNIDVGEANTKDIVEYLTLQLESKFTKCNEITQTKIMSKLEKHADGSYIYLVLPSVQFWLIFLWGFIGLYYSLLSWRNVQADMK